MATRLRNLHSTPVTQRQQEHPDQVANSAGGFSFQVSPWDLLDRFLVLGSEGATYYIDAPTLTRENSRNIVSLIKADGIRVVNRIIEISDSGRAARNDPALFALALCIAEGDDETRSYAYANLGKVARIGTHLFHLADYLKGMGKGWGKGLRKAVAGWYTNMPAEKLEYQLVKYQQRDGWSHRDMLRLSHPFPTSPTQQGIFHWVTKGEILSGARMPMIRAHMALNDNSSAKDVVNAILEHGLPREAIPTKFLNEVQVWDALLEKMPMHAMVRNLGKMTQVGLIKPASKATMLIANKLSNKEAISKSRMHPLQLLVAGAVYGSGSGFRGSLTWNAERAIIDALDDAFYLAFGNVEPTGKRTLMGLDVSGSMSCQIGPGMPISCAMGTAAMSLVTARVEKAGSYAIRGFSTDFVDLGISPRMSLNQAMRHTQMRNFGSTDCSLPMAWAMQEKLEFDTFIVYTDSETWAGMIHPHKALEQYRQKTGIPAKLIVVGMCANQFTIANPNDAGMLDVVGFDAAAPQIMSDFARQEMVRR